MKQRFSSLDVKVIAHELSHCLPTLRLANVYDLSSRIFLLKFAKPDNRRSLVIDSGFRCHLTDYTRATAAAPSAFVARLRKFLRTRRVTSVSQVGTDRIIELQFSDGQYRLFLEFYAGGNIVLTDGDLKIIGALRNVTEEREKIRIGLQYTLQNRQNYGGIPLLTEERVQQGLQQTIEKLNEESAVLPKRSKRPGDALRKALATSLNELPPLVIEHALRVASFDSQTPVKAVLEDPYLMKALMVALEKARQLVSDITGTDVCRGYIIAKPSRINSTRSHDGATDSAEIGRTNLMYEDFHPFRPKQCEEDPEATIIEFDGFNKTVDEFFSSIESQRISSRLTEKEENAKRKLDTARLEHKKRLDSLHQVQELNVRKAQAIEANLPRVQEAIVAINGLLAQGMDWMDISRLIEMEKAKQNVVANMIKLPLKLYENSATFLLAEGTFSEEDDYEGEETDSDASEISEDDHDLVAQSNVGRILDENRLAVDIDLALSPWSNARLYYDQKKSAAVKEQKTLQSSDKALKSTEKKISSDLKKGLKQEKEVLRPQRKAFWFEKFIYFISSEGYLVLGGKDAPQSEILYRNYLKKGDVYIHADLQGAASVIIKKRAGRIDSPIPPSTLSQAGTLAVATSSAWDSKAGMSAWWVNADQVSKTAPTGEYLDGGAFTVRGQKNFLPPAHLLLGFGLLFQISEESKARHFKHRVDGDTLAMASATGQGVEGKDIVEEGAEVEEEESSIVEQAESEAELQRIESDHEDNGIDIANADQAEVDNKVLKGLDDDSVSDSEHLNPLQPTLDWRSDSHSEKLDTGKHDTYTGLQPSRSTDNKSKDQISKLGTRHLAIKTVKPGLTGGEHRIPPITGLISSEGPLSTDEQYEAESESPNSSRDVELLDPDIPSRSKRPTMTAPKSQTHLRGKHSKRNKLKSKYANQDEEDRALAMRLLGSAAAQEKITEEAAAKAAKQQEFAEHKERRRRQYELAAIRGKESEEIRRLKFEEDIDNPDDEEVVGSDDLDAFVGAPLPGDEILDVLVMCGPWSAIGGRCNWRAKLQPGTTKKGKAVREILGKWTSVIKDGEKRRRPGSGDGNEAMVEEEKTRRRESELVQGIREPEVIGIVPVSKVRVSMGPGEASGKGKGMGAGGKVKGGRGGKGSKKPR